ncbi:MAG: polysaccharide biosynthesis tyrosine autokinase [Chitinophagaceae bacterium]
MDEQVTKSKNDLWSLSIRDLFFKYLRYLPLIILCVVLAMAGAFVYLRYATQVYSSSGLMLIQNDQKNSNNSDKVEDILLGTGKLQNIANELEILKSRPLMARVVRGLDLSFSIVANGKIKDQNVYKQVPFQIQARQMSDSSRSFTLAIRFLTSQQFIVNGMQLGFNEAFKTSSGTFILKRISEAVPDAEYTIRWSPVASVAAGLVGGLTIQPKSMNSGIVGVSMRTTNPILAADVVNNLMKEYSQMNIEQNNFSTDQMLKFINGRLVILNRELDSAQQKLLVYQQTNDLIDIDIQSADYFANITEGDRALIGQETSLSMARIVDTYLQNTNNQYEKVVVPSSLGLEDPVLNQLILEYNKSQIARQSLIESGTPAGNPMVKSAESEIELLRKSILENLNNIESSYEATIRRLQSGRRLTQSNIQALPYKIKEYIELKRQVDIKMELVKQLEGKREEAAIARASTISNSRIIEEAGKGGAVEPNSLSIQIWAFLIGLGIPVLFIFMKELINDKVTSRNELERITSAPIVGEIGHSYNDNVLIVNSNSRSMVAEQFRIIRSNLQYIIGKVEKPVIMVTSSHSGEGKSFVSINMGAVMSVTGKRTIVLEFDIRKPKVLAGLKMPTRSAGISNFLAGNENIEKLIVAVPGMDNLFVLPCGPIPPNPAELLLEKQVSDLFAYLKANFDVVIIDTAPVGMVSDAVTLGNFADCTLYIVRQGYTYKKQISLIDELYSAKKIPSIAIVINDVKMKSGYGYYGYGRYGYGRNYGNSYYDDQLSPSLWQRIMNSIGVVRKK